MCLIDGAEDRSPHLIGLENGVGGEDMHICTLLVPGCLVALEVIELFPVLTTTDISAGHDWHQCWPAAALSSGLFSWLLHLLPAVLFLSGVWTSLGRVLRCGGQPVHSVTVASTGLLGIYNLLAFFGNRSKMPSMVSKSCLACLEELYHMCSSNSQGLLSGFVASCLGYLKLVLHCVCEWHDDEKPLCPQESCYQQRWSYPQ